MRPSPWQALEPVALRLAVRSRLQRSELCLQPTAAQLPCTATIADIETRTWRHLTGRVAGQKDAF